MIYLTQAKHLPKPSLRWAGPLPGEDSEGDDWKQTTPFSRAFLLAWGGVGGGDPSGASTVSLRPLSAGRSPPFPGAPAFSLLTLARPLPLPILSPHQWSLGTLPLPPSPVSPPPFLLAEPGAPSLFPAEPLWSQAVSPTCPCHSV